MIDASDGQTETAQSSVDAGSVNLPAGRGVHNLGYRGWSGSRAPGWMRWIDISKVGIRRSSQSSWLKRLLFFAWIPAIGFGVAVFLWEQAANYDGWRHFAHPLLQSMPETPVFNQIRESVRAGDFASGRHTIWAYLLNTFIRYPQAVLMLLVIGLIAPPLISQDIRSRAFLLYFSRPLSRSEYLIGKLATIWAYLAMISTVPALSLYFLGVMLSPSLSVIAATWDLPLRILAASLVLMLPASTLALSLSSLTQESRNAGFAWFAIWILGWFTYGALSAGEAFYAEQQFHRHHEIVIHEQSAWTHLSLYHTLGRVQSWVFGFAELKDVAVSLVILISVTLISLGVLFNRISAPMRV